MRIVVAMDSFKDSLTAERACRVVADSIRTAVPTADIMIKPMADGGEGTAMAMIAARISTASCPIENDSRSSLME